MGEAQIWEDKEKEEDRTRQEETRRRYEEDRLVAEARLLTVLAMSEEDRQLTIDELDQRQDNGGGRG